MHRSGGLRWRVGVALAFLASAAVDAAALEVCTAAQVTAKDPGCPPGDGVCTITLGLNVTNSLDCRLDFGARDVRLQNSLDGAGTVSLSTGRLTVDPGARIRAPHISITAQGDVTVRRVAGSVPGLLEVANFDEYEEGDLQVSTPGHFLLEGRIDADANGAGLAAGKIEINATGGITTGPDSLLSADARLYDEWLGALTLDTMGPVLLQGTVNLRGPDEGEDQLGGEIQIYGGSLRLAPGTVLRGGTIDADIHGDVRIERESASRRALIEADEAGSSIVIAATGDLLVTGEVSTNGSSCELGINYLGLNAEGALTVAADALLSASGVPDPESEEVCSAYVDIGASGPLLFEGTLVQLGGGDPEGDVYISGGSDGDVTVRGRIRLDGWYQRSSGGSLNISGYNTVIVDSEITTVAGASTLGIEYGGYSGNVFISGSDVSVGGSILADGPLYGDAGLIDIDAGDGDLTVTATLSAHAHRLHGSPGRVHIQAGSLDYTGSIDVGNAGEVRIRGSELDIGGRIIGHTQPDPRPYYLDEPKVSVGSYSGCGDGRVTLSGLIDLSAFGCEGGECAEPWEVEVTANEVTLTPSAVVENTGRVGGPVRLEGRQIELAGRIDVSGAETDGVVEVARCAGAAQPCTVMAEIEPPSALMNGCLLPPATLTPTYTPVPTRTRTPSPTTGPITCPGDCDGDGVVESTDLMSVLSLVNLCQGNAGGCGLVAASCANADLDHSGTLSAGEVSRVVGTLGRDCHQEEGAGF